jgi:hypothetical protein
LDFSGIEKEGFPKPPEAQGVYHETFDCFQERQLIGALRRTYLGEKPGLLKTGLPKADTPETE